MASLIRFEVQIPLFNDGTPQQSAVDQFLESVRTLCDYVQTSAYVARTTGEFEYTGIIYGLITSTQQSTALGYLNTLNTALGKNVLCTVNPVTSEP